MIGQITNIAIAPYWSKLVLGFFKYSVSEFFYMRNLIVRSSYSGEVRKSTKTADWSVGLII